MKVTIAVCILATVWLQLPSGGEAVCCYPHKYQKHTFSTGKRCDDCRFKVAYCGVGSCNVFGCNCDGGCRTGPCANDQISTWGRRSAHEDTRSAHERIRSGRDVIRAADTDGDSLMSVEEARAHLHARGIPAHGIKRALKELDADKDGFFSAAEIDSQ